MENKEKKSKKKYFIIFGLVLSIMMLIVGSVTQKGDKVDDVYIGGFGIGMVILLIGCCMKSQKKLNKEVAERKEKQYDFKSLQSGKASIIIDDDKITIKRKGLLAMNSHGLTGEKTIKINQITAVQLKEAKVGIGYIKFVVPGSQETKSGLQGAMRDENAVCFDGGFNNEKVNQEAKEIKDYIESFQSKEKKNKEVVISQEDKYDKLAKLKKLLNDEVITQEEFESEKAKLLK